MGEKKVVVRVDDRLHHKARVESVKRGVPISVIVREALAAFVADAARRRETLEGGTRNKTK